MAEADDEVEINSDVPPPVVGIAIIYVLLFGAALGLIALTDTAILENFRPENLGRDSVWGLVIGSILVVLSGVLRAKSQLFDDLEEAVRERLGGLGLGGILALALLSSVAEELFFRGFLQPYLGQSLDSPLVGLILTSCFFGLLHRGPSSRISSWTLFAIACGFILGWLRWETGGLWAPILVHLLVNGVNMARILERSAVAIPPPAKVESEKRS